MTNVDPTMPPLTTSMPANPPCETLFEIVDPA